MRRALPLLGLLALGVSGCGDGESEREIRDVVSALHAAYLAEDYERVCDHLSASARLELGSIGHSKPTTCPADMRGRMSAAILSPRDMIEAPIREIDIDDDEASVSAMLGGTTPGVLRFVHEDGEWKLAKLFSVSAPPPPDMR